MSRLLDARVIRVLVIGMVCESTPLTKLFLICSRILIMWFDEVILVLISLAIRVKLILEVCSRELVGASALEFGRAMPKVP